MADEVYEQIAMPDTMKLSEIIVRAKGTKRTMAQMAEACKVSASTLSRIANGKITKPLSVDMLKAIYENRAEDSEISFDSILLANGTAKKTNLERGKAFVDAVLGYGYNASNERIRRLVKNTIVRELMDRGLVVQKIPDSFERRRTNAPFGLSLPFDFNFYVPDAKQQLLYFKVLDAVDGITGTGKVYSTVSRFFLLDAWEPSFYDNSRTTFVFTHENIIQQFVAQYHGAPIHTPMSAMLVDVNAGVIKNEVMLSGVSDEESVFARPKTDQDGFIAAWEKEEDYEDSEGSEGD